MYGCIDSDTPKQYCKICQNNHRIGQCETQDILNDQDSTYKNMIFFLFLTSYIKNTSTFIGIKDSSRFQSLREVWVYILTENSQKVWYSTGHVFHKILPLCSYGRKIEDTKTGYLKHQKPVGLNLFLWTR